MVDIRDIGRFFGFIVGGLVAIIVGAFMIRGTMHMWDKPVNSQDKNSTNEPKESMVGPKDGGFGFDQSKKYTSIDNLDEICVQCQAGQHKRCLKKTKQQQNCECEHCMIYG